MLEELMEPQLRNIALIARDPPISPQQHELHAKALDR